MCLSERERACVSVMFACWIYENVKERMREWAEERVIEGEREWVRWIFYPWKVNWDRCFAHFSHFVCISMCRQFKLLLELTCTMQRFNRSFVALISFILAVRDSENRKQRNSDRELYRWMYVFHVVVVFALKLKPCHQTHSTLYRICFRTIRIRMNECEYKWQMKCKLSVD